MRYVQSGTKSNSTKSEIPCTSMYFYVYKKTYCAPAGQHIIMLLACLVSFESYMNKVIFVLFSLISSKFESCKDLVNFAISIRTNSFIRA